MPGRAAWALPSLGVESVKDLRPERPADHGDPREHHGGGGGGDGASERVLLLAGPALFDVILSWFGPGLGWKWLLKWRNSEDYQAYKYL